MIKEIQNLFSLLSKSQLKQLAVVQITIVIMTFTEVTSMLILWRLVSIIMNPSIIHSSDYLQRSYDWLGMSSNTQFIIILALFLACFSFVSTIISIICVRKSSFFIFRLGAKFKEQLYCYFIHKSWLYHTERNGSTLVKQIVTEVDRLITGVLTPVIQTNARIILAFGVFILLFSLDLLLVLVVTIGLLVFYVSFYMFFRLKLKKNGEVITKGNRERQQLVNESFGGIKDILLFNSQDKFFVKFSTINNQMRNSLAKNLIFPQVPRYVIEFIMINVLIWAIIYTFGGISLDAKEELVPLLSVYAIATFKLLPAFQMIYSNIATIRGNIDVVSVLHTDLKESMDFLIEEKSNNQLNLQNSLDVKNISFRYPGNTSNTLQNISLGIPAKKSIALVGSSGAGKSTLLDVLLGLILVDKGKILVDGQRLNKSNVISWQKNIGYVAQDVFLLDGSIAENIAFGISTDEIDYVKIQQTIQYVQLEELLDSLTDGVNTIVGERGVKLSGGQKQRIAIARSLYYDVDILMMDEATNALDGLTEKMIIKTINSFANTKTIIMIAHRLNTVKHCDIIYFMDNGKVVDFGTYEELLTRNSHFKEMADLS